MSCKQTALLATGSLEEACRVAACRPNMVFSQRRISLGLKTSARSFETKQSLPAGRQALARIVSKKI